MKKKFGEKGGKKAKALAAAEAAPSSSAAPIDDDQESGESLLMEEAEDGEGMESYESASDGDDADEEPAKRPRLSNGHAKEVLKAAEEAALSALREARKAKKARAKARRAEALAASLAKDRVARAKPRPVHDRERERFLLKVGTRGVVALFNAVNEHQSKMAKEEDAAGPSLRKKDRARAKVARDKGSFVERLKAPTAAALAHRDDDEQ